MITIPTADWVGLLNDVIPFAHPEDDLPSVNAVQLHWDGKMLRAAATDLHRIAISSWHPNDDTSGGGQMSVVNPYGSGDSPWSLLISLANAEDIAKKFKLNDKLGSMPVTVDTDMSRMTVRRERFGGLLGIRVDVDGLEEDYDDLQARLDKHRVFEPVQEIEFNATFIADFAKVRQRGPMKLRFCGATRFTHVSIGDRFVGAIAPLTVEARRASQSSSAASDL